ncbi:MAG: hypothetical protein IMW93_09790 [Thermoanaerobacteraceae bacterium]|nr:hypothetical protein [Thermoanaerobacteraceae bacterium]
MLNLTGRPQTDTYSFDCLDLTVIAFSYRLINLVDLPGEEVLKHGPVGIIPLVPLMRHQLPDEEVLAECARRIEEAPAEWQPDLYFGLALFSSLRYTREIILKIIEVSKMETSPLFDGIREKWIDQGEQRGLQKGLQQGSREERIKAIMEALEENTGCYPEDLGDRLRVIQDMDILKALFRRAVKAKSLEEFTSALNEIAKLNN